MLPALPLDKHSGDVETEAGATGTARRLVARPGEALEQAVAKVGALCPVPGR